MNLSMHVGRLIRVETYEGARQGRFQGLTSTHLYLHDGMRREIDLCKITGVSEPRLEQCLDDCELAS